jgi:hypothetical protein
MNLDPSSLSAREKYNKILPAKAMHIPNIFIAGILCLKNSIPNRITKTGVSEFRTPAAELLIPVSAAQNK